MRMWCVHEHLLNTELKNVCATYAAYLSLAYVLDLSLLLEDAVPAQPVLVHLRLLAADGRDKRRDAPFDLLEPLRRALLKICVCVQLLRRHLHETIGVNSAG